jgi:glycosyltransferase involved in cell wall biosynthesis
MPKVTVCVPTYNRATDLMKALATIRQQTFSDWQVLVGDDASTDDTVDVVAAVHDRRIRLVQRSRNLGIYGNWNDLIGRCDSKYVCIYHDHDLYLPSILSTTVSLMDDNSSMQFAHTALVMIDSGDRIVQIDQRDFAPVTDGREFRRILANSWASPVMAATVMARRSVYDAVGPYRPDLYGLGCDTDMWFQMAGRGSVGYVPSPQALIRARERGGATSRFSWPECLQAIRMREDHLLATRDHGGQVIEREFRADCDRRLAPFAVRSLLLDDPALAAEGFELVRPYVGWRTKSIQTALNSVPLLIDALRRFALPLHYRRIAARERANVLQAREFERNWASRELVQNLLGTVGSSAPSPVSQRRVS